MSDLSDLNRDIGVMQGELKGIVATLARVDERSAARDEAFEEIRNELRKMAANIETLNKHAQDSIEIGKKFNALSQSIRDGAMQAKGVGKGIGIGIVIASASGGAAVVAFGKELWKLIFPA